MASFCGIPVELVMEWSKIRDLFFGDNCTQDVKLAVEMAAKCQHPDAIWLASVCAGESVKNADDARLLFRRLGREKKDARALCFVWALGDLEEDLDLLSEAAELGCASAQAWMSVRSEGAIGLQLATLATEKGERDGLYMLGEFHRKENDQDKAIKYFKVGFVFCVCVCVFFFFFSCSSVGC